jgi:hypothetical protein
MQPGDDQRLRLILPNLEHPLAVSTLARMPSPGDECARQRGRCRAMIDHRAGDNVARPTAGAKERL